LTSRFRNDLRRVIRHRLNDRLRPQFDTVDFMQSVWTVFFTLPPDQFEFADFKTLRSFLLDLAATRSSTPGGGIS